MLEGKNEQIKAEYRRDAALVYASANLNAFAFSSPKTMPKIYEAFPGIIERPVGIKRPEWLKDSKKVVKV